ncbi:MAG: hypothetical protein DCF25_11905 [Leptolyngbya foveolarum]|uniref:Uncharacterized protein n=1 Tax=Leptolyngbya foveolarum TaxID=47253 RepID=A0A2W4U8H6_9CYAN|nr:MAG: hypothetical protein DCF25_11905 [Leptolyngbya foveolarum]
MSNQTAQLIEQMMRMATALERQAAPVVPQGFCNYGLKVYCNVTKGNGDGWYTLADGAATTQKPMFRGEIVSIGFPTVERRGQEVRKFHLVMRANSQTVTFESGHDCFFSKTILAAFALTSPEVLVQQIQLATYIKELRTGDKTLAVSLRDRTGIQLSNSWQNDDDWNAIATAAISNVNDAIAVRA